MKYSGIGGQAVLEGVMMKNKEKYAVAVRKPDGEITVDTKEYYGLIKNKTLRNIPILRGVLSFVESLTLGISTLTYSASFFEEDEEEDAPEVLDADETTEDTSSEEAETISQDEE